MKMTNKISWFNFCFPSEKIPVNNRRDNAGRLASSTAGKNAHLNVGSLILSAYEYAATNQGNGPSFIQTAWH